MTNLHAIGAALTNAMRPHVAGHRIVLRRGTAADPQQESEAIDASSPPIGQQLLTETGLTLSEHDRVFFFKITLLGSYGLPRKGDTVIDLCDGSEWRILPDGRNQAWRYHGQNRTMIQILCKADAFPT